MLRLLALVLQGKGRKVLEKKRTAESPAVYRWKIERKR